METGHNKWKINESILKYSNIKDHKIDICAVSQTKRKENGASNYLYASSYISV